jgi:hypothetical protein
LGLPWAGEDALSSDDLKRSWYEDFRYSQDFCNLFSVPVPNLSSGRKIFGKFAWSHMRLSFPNELMFNKGDLRRDPGGVIPLLPRAGHA